MTRTSMTGSGGVLRESVASTKSGKATDMKLLYHDDMKAAGSGFTSPGEGGLHSHAEESSCWHRAWCFAHFVLAVGQFIQRLVAPSLRLAAGGSHRSQVASRTEHIWPSHVARLTFSCPWSLRPGFLSKPSSWPKKNWQRTRGSKTTRCQTFLKHITREGRDE